MTPVTKPRPIEDEAWWSRYTAPVLEFVAERKAVSWKELRKFAREHAIAPKHMPDVVAFLDIKRAIHQDGKMWRPGPPPGVT